MSTSTLHPAQAAFVYVDYAQRPSFVDGGRRIKATVSVQNNGSLALNSAAAPRTRLLFFAARSADASDVSLRRLEDAPLRLEVPAHESREYDVEIHAPEGDAPRIYLFAGVVGEQDEPTASLSDEAWVRHTLVRPDPAQESWWTDAEAENVVYGGITELNQSRLRRFLGDRHRKRPLLLHLETVNICNLKCIICPYDQMSRAKETMSTDLFRKVVSDYVEMGGGDVALTPSVGDVLLDKKLVERVRYLKGLPGIRDLGFVTNAGNAAVFSDAELETIVNACRRINISIYGLDEVETAAMTRRSGRYGTILAQAKRMVEANHGEAVIVFAFRLLKERAQERAEAWMLEHFGRIFPHGVLTTFGNWAGAMDTSVQLPFSGQWADQSVGGHGDGPCAYPVMNLKVSVNGDVKFCSCIDYDSNAENIVGNAWNASLSDIYNGSTAKRLWRRGLSICDGCTHAVPMSKLLGLYDYLDEPIGKLGV